MQESAFGSTTANTTANNNSNWQQLHAAQAAGHVESLHATSLIFQEQANLISFFSFLHVSLCVQLAVQQGVSLQLLCNCNSLPQRIVPARQLAVSQLSPISLPPPPHLSLSISA